MKARPLPLLAWEIRAILKAYESGLTMVEVAKKLGLPSEYHVKRICKEHGVSRPAKRRTGVAAGANNPAWKGGRRIRKDGYVLVWTPGGERLEHRVIMERYLGRPLLDSEIIHHEDGDKQNNTPENLRVMSQSDHCREHLEAMHAARYGR